MDHEKSDKKSLNSQVPVDISEWAMDVGDGSGEPPVVLDDDDCVVKLDVSSDSVSSTAGSLLISLQVSPAVSEIVIDIRRPPERVFVSYVIVVVVYSSRDETPSGDTL